jgi:Flp pilus assembly protein TadG
MMRRFHACTRAGVLVFTAIALPVLVAFASLSVEVGHWYLVQREMQGAADAAAISAAADYINFLDNGVGTATDYRGVGVSYAGINGFTIVAANVCLVTSSGNNCDASHPTPINCATPPCVVVDIAQAQTGMFLPISEPTIKARSVVSISSLTQTITTQGTDCVLALANASNAVSVNGNGDLKANCGLAIDGGIDQNKSGTALGGITFSGAPSKVNITNLTLAAKSTACPGSHCFLFNPPTTALPASAVKTSTATVDPLAGTTFPTLPLGATTGGVAIKTAGSGYTNGTRTFTVQGGTGSPTIFTATVSGGKITAILSIADPGGYTVMPANPVSAKPNTGGGTGATFTLTQGCFTWNGTPIPGRTYCSINLNGAGKTNFPAGSYYIAGGDPNCVGFCVSSANATATSDAAGVTFYLTHGFSGASNANNYAYVAITSGTVSLCAPGTNCGTTCDVQNASGSQCILFYQDRNATSSTSPVTPSTTDNEFGGNGTRTLSGLMYLPAQTFDSQGNGTINGCLGVIAKYVVVSGTPTFSNGCLPGGGFGGTTTTTTTSKLKLTQ